MKEKTIGFLAKRAATTAQGASRSWSPEAMIRFDSGKSISFL